MSIKIKKKNLQKVVREEYIKALNEDNSEMSREGTEAMRDIAFKIAKQLAKRIDAVSMNNQIDSGRLLVAIIDQVKLQMKDR